MQPIHLGEKVGQGQGKESSDSSYVLKTKTILLFMTRRLLCSVVRALDF